MRNKPYFTRMIRHKKERKKMIKIFFFLHEYIFFRDVNIHINTVSFLYFEDRKETSKEIHRTEKNHHLIFLKGFLIKSIQWQLLSRSLQNGLKANRILHLVYLEMCFQKLATLQVKQCSRVNKGKNSRWKTL
jgi:hypothetical protein